MTDDLVTITLGGFATELRESLDAPWRSLAANPGNNLTAAHPNSPWVFRGYSPGQHIHAMHQAEGVANSGPRVKGYAGHGHVSNSSHGVLEGLGQVPT